MNYEATIEDPATVQPALEDQRDTCTGIAKRTRGCWSSSAWSSPNSCCTATWCESPVGISNLGGVVIAQEEGDFHESANFPVSLAWQPCWLPVCRGASGSQNVRGGQARSQGGIKSELPYAAPKTPWGDPDLQGTWTSDDTWGVPFERPKNFGTRATLTEDELKDRAEECSEVGGIR